MSITLLVIAGVIAGWLTGRLGGLVLCDCPESPHRTDALHAASWLGVVTAVLSSLGAYFAGASPWLCTALALSGGAVLMLLMMVVELLNTCRLHLERRVDAIYEKCKALMKR